jgi:hypothetical protein
MNIFVLFLLGYLLYRFIAGFLVPVFRTTRQMRQQFHDVNGRSNNPAGHPPNPGSTPGGNNGKPAEPKTGSSPVGEYIDFEEIK